MSAVSIRPARAADAEAIAEVHAASWRDVYQDTMPAGYLRDRALADLTRHWRETELRADEVILVATIGDEVVGFIAIYRRPEHGPTPYLDNLHVRPSNRSGGLGGRLLIEAANQLRRLGENTLYLWLVDGNDAAQRFYERLGGLPTERSSKEVFGVPLKTLKIEWDDLGPIIRGATAASQ